MTTAAQTPAFTNEELQKVYARFFSLLITPEDFDWLTIAMLGWDTTCWNCGEKSYVWMDVDLKGPGISDDCLRRSVRRMFGDRAEVPLALIGTVHTKAGGTYLGFTCPWCRSVLGKHFLRLELMRRMLDDPGSIDTNWFDDAPEQPMPVVAFPPLDEDETPELRVRKFLQWRKRANKAIAFHGIHLRLPGKHDGKLGRWAKTLRRQAKAGTLAPERRAYIDMFLPDVLPVPKSERAEAQPVVVEPEMSEEHAAYLAATILQV